MSTESKSSRVQELFSVLRFPKDEDQIDDFSEKQVSIMERFGKCATIEELREVIDYLYTDEFDQDEDITRFRDNLEWRIDKNRVDLIKEYISYVYKIAGNHKTRIIKNLLRTENYDIVKELLSKNFDHHAYVLDVYQNFYS